MTNRILSVLLLVLSCVTFSCFASTTQNKVLYSINFSNLQKVSDVKSWLEDQGYEIQKDSSDLSLYNKDNSVVFDTKSRLFFFAIKSDLDLKNAKTIKISWGVNSFPANASYEKGIRNEGLMVYVYYGKKDLDSGSIFIPDAPYFIGLFLSKDDAINKYYVGSHFTEGGRFLCLGNPKLNETVVSEFNLQKGFKDAFGENKKVPPITGLALEVETTSTGPAKAFIKNIEIYSIRLKIENRLRKF